MRMRRFMKVLFIIVILLLAFAIAHAMGIQAAQIAIVPGSAVRGARVFQDKQCAQCHSLADLKNRSGRTATPALLASTMWNHTPMMWSALGSNPSRPPMSSLETADLFSYFYSLDYFTDPGDAARGKAVFEEKHCAGCHTSSDGRPPKGPALAEWAETKDPINWAERMWNHSGAMWDEMQKSGVRWPQLSPENIVDLFVYIRNLPSSRSQAATFQPGEPELGRVVFEQRCDTCHAFGAKLPHKIDLLDRPGPRTLTGYVAAMWNHAPTMHRMAGSTFPVLAQGEMTNLIAYLFAQRYFFEKGDVARGQRVFREKNCYRCHEERRAQTGAPNLTQQNEQFSPVTMASAVWRHGPAMLEAMRLDHLTWPEFHDSEMTNLIAYLNSRLNPKIAK